MNYVDLPNDSRLGNWMFQCALGLSLGEEFALYTRVDSVANLFSNYPGFFHNVKLVRELPADVEVYREKGFEYEAIPPNETAKDRYLVGYFQSEKYFADKERVREFFAPSREMVETLQSKYGDWLKRPNVTGISVRRGDYMRLAYLLPFCGKKYYKDCIAKIPEAEDFIVCTDDFTWCKKWFPKAFPNKHFLFMEGQPVLEQLYIHTFCKNVIMSNSTFSWWSAWLNNTPKKRVFAPSMWLGFVHRGKTDWSTIYANDMEIVQNGYSFGLWCYSHWKLLDKKFRVVAVKLLRKFGLKK